MTDQPKTLSRRYEHSVDPVYLKKNEEFERWYENPLDLPGRWYLQAIRQLFKENRFCKGEFVALGRTIGLHDITCPTFLMAGEGDDITPYPRCSKRTRSCPRRRTRSSRNWCRAATSACSWVRAP